MDSHVHSKWIIKEIWSLISYNGLGWWLVDHVGYWVLMKLLLRLLVLCLKVLLFHLELLRYVLLLLLLLLVVGLLLDVLIC